MTFDLDFGEIVALSAAATSVVVFRLRRRSAEAVIARLRRVLEESQPALERGAVVTVKDARHRVRALPLLGLE